MNTFSLFICVHSKQRDFVQLHTGISNTAKVLLGTVLIKSSFSQLFFRCASNYMYLSWMQKQLYMKATTGILLKTIRVEIQCIYLPICQQLLNNVTLQSCLTTDHYYKCLSFDKKWNLNLNNLWHTVAIYEKAQ